MWPAQVTQLMGEWNHNPTLQVLVAPTRKCHMVPRPLWILAIKLNFPKTTIFIHLNNQNSAHSFFPQSNPLEVYSVPNSLFQKEVSESQPSKPVSITFAADGTRVGVVRWDYPGFTVGPQAYDWGSYKTKERRSEIQRHRGEDGGGD